MRIFEFRVRQTYVVKTGNDCSTANPLAQEWVPRVLGDDHYKGTSRVTVGVVR